MQLFYEHRYPRRRLKNNPRLKNSASWNKTFARFAHRRHLKIISLLKKSRIYISSICCWLQISPICHLFKSSSSSGGSAKTNAVGRSGKSGSIEHQYTVPINGFWKRKNWRWASKPPPSDLYVANPSRLVDTCLEQGEHTESTVRKFTEFNSFTHYYHICPSFFGWICQTLQGPSLNSLVSFLSLLTLLSLLLDFTILYFSCFSLCLVRLVGMEAQTLEADRRFIYTLFPSFHLQNLFLQRKKNGRGETRIKNTKRIAT